MKMYRWFPLLSYVTEKSFICNNVLDLRKMHATFMMNSQCVASIIFNNCQLHNNYILILCMYNMYKLFLHKKI